MSSYNDSEWVLSTKFLHSISISSRSNAIALGALVYYFKMDFHKAMEIEVSSKVPICCRRIYGAVIR